MNIVDLDTKTMTTTVTLREVNKIAEANKKAGC